MNKRHWGWLMFSFLAAALAVLLVPIAQGQGAAWVVTVGGGAPKTVEVGVRAVPLLLIVDGSEPIPAALRTRLVLASVFAAAAIPATLLWRRSNVE